MTTNPMQRKARNSFLLGMFIMLLITGVIIAFLFIQLNKKIQAERELKNLSVKAYALTQDVNSGQIITPDMLQKIDVNKGIVPSNATSDISIIENYALQDKEGHNIITKVENNKHTLYIVIDREQYELLQEETENYYYMKDNKKNYVELDSVPLIAKVTMKKNTLITTDLLSKSDNVLQDDTRRQEYNMLVLPMDLKTGDYVDIRLMLPSGQDYIVVPKKEVELPVINGVDSEDTIWVDLTEDEILHMSCAIIDAYKIRGSKLYVTKYKEAGMQQAATPNYPINESVSRELENDPNILERAMREILARYNQTGGVTLRNDYINKEINNQGEQAQSNLETNMQESITNSKNLRKEYLDSLTGAVE